jgi:glycosyltransferase involved in cell wall biosynthesis
MPEAGIVIVTYNSQAEIGPCLDAALATGAEMVVVDNASHDGTSPKCPPRRAADRQPRRTADSPPP